MPFIISKIPQLLDLAHHKASDAIKPLVLIFVACLLFCRIEYGPRLHKGFVGLKPLQAPVAPEYMIRRSREKTNFWY